MPTRLAIVVSHPIQYYVPLYRRLAARTDIIIKVFYTWHAGGSAHRDRGFGREFAWDIPLTGGYDFEAVPNVSIDPGTHHFRGLRNPELWPRIAAWQPDVIHLTGYAYASHLALMRSAWRRGLSLLFRGDSHRLDREPRWKRIVKRVLLRVVYRWPSAFLYVGAANRRYYEALGVPDRRLFPCPHSIDVERFAEPAEALEMAAARWRGDLGIPDRAQVLLFAGKFEPRKRPVELMRAFARELWPDRVLVMAGDGPLGPAVRREAERRPDLFRVVPFQNQSRMPILYRVGDAFVLPSGWGESWGLAVNEALACGRPALVSDRVGCAADVIQPGVNGDLFAADDWDEFRAKLPGVLRLRTSNATAILTSARAFDIPATEAALLRAVAHTALWNNP